MGVSGALPERPLRGGDGDSDEAADHRGGDDATVLSELRRTAAAVQRLARVWRPHKVASFERLLPIPTPRTPMRPRSRNGAHEHSWSKRRRGRYRAGAHAAADSAGDQQQGDGNRAGVEGTRDRSGRLGEEGAARTSG